MAAKKVPVSSFNLGATTALAYTDSAAASAAITANVVRLCATTACHVRIGTNPTAVATDYYLPANVVEYVYFPTGSKISAIRNATNGTLFITVGL